MNTTPASLLERLRQAPAAANWQRFADLYTPLLYYWAKRLSLQESDAADLVQDVFVRLVEKLPEFRYDQARSFRSWLHTVLLNEWRTRKRKKAVAGDGRGDMRLSDVEASDELEKFSEAEYHQYLAQRALRLMQVHFQPTTWRACWMQVVAGASAAEVAAELGISEGAAYVAKSRVLRRLREELDGLLE